MSTTSSMSRSPTRPYLRTAPQSTSPSHESSAEKQLNNNHHQTDNTNKDNSPHPSYGDSSVAAAVQPTNRGTAQQLPTAAATVVPMAYVSPRHHASPDVKRNAVGVGAGGGDSESQLLNGRHTTIEATPPRQIIPLPPSQQSRRSQENSSSDANPMSPSTTATLLEDALAALAVERQRCEKLHQNLLTNSSMRRKLKEENAALKEQLAVLSHKAETGSKLDSNANANKQPSPIHSNNNTEAASSSAAKPAPSTSAEPVFPLSDLKTVVDEAMIAERTKYEGLLQQYKQRVDELEFIIAKKDTENAKLRDRVEAFSPLRVKHFVHETEGEEEEDGNDNETLSKGSPTRSSNEKSSSVVEDHSVGSKTRSYTTIDAMPTTSNNATSDGSPLVQGRAASEAFRRADDVVYRGADFDGGERVPPPEPVSFVSLSNEEELRFQQQHQNASSTTIATAAVPLDGPPNNKEPLLSGDVEVEDDLLNNAERLGPEALQHAVVYLFRRLRGAEIVLVEVQQESRGLRSERDKLLADVSALQRRLAVVSPRNSLLTGSPSSPVAIAGRRGGPGFISPSGYRSGGPSKPNSAAQSRTASRSPVRGPTTPTPSTTASTAVTSRVPTKASTSTAPAAAAVPQPQTSAAPQPQQQHRSALIYRTVSPVMKRHLAVGGASVPPPPQQQQHLAAYQQQQQAQPSTSSSAPPATTTAVKKSPFHLGVTATALAGLTKEQQQQQLSLQPASETLRLQRDRSPLFRNAQR